MAVDVNQLIEDARARRADADAKKAIADQLAASLKAEQKGNAKFKAQAQQKLDYANAIQQTIADYEDRLQIYAQQIARDGKLNTIDQKEFERIAKDYTSVSKAYDKTITDVNAILAKAPTPVSVEVTKGKAGITKTEKQKQAEAVAKGETPGSVDIASENAKLDASIKDARQFIYDLNKPGARADLAKKLTDAGYPAPASNEFNDPLVQAYKAFLLGAKSYNTNNKDVTGFTPVNVDSYMAYATGLQKTGANAGNAYTPQADIYSGSRASGAINREIQTAFGRDATPVEISTLTKALQKIQGANPQRRSGTNVYSYTGGVDAAETIRLLITDPTSADYTGLDKKTKDNIIKNVSKLNLATDFAKRKEDKTAVALEDIKKTAQANGLPLNDVMIQKYADRIKAGETADVIKKDIRSIVAATMPDSVKKLLDAGSDLADVYSPYKTAMSSVLEIPYDKIDINDPSLAGAITAAGNMPLYEYKNALRKDPRWQYTDNARQTVSTGLTQVLKDFGFMG